MMGSNIVSRRIFLEKIPYFTEKEEEVKLGREERIKQLCGSSSHFPDKAQHRKAILNKTLYCGHGQPLCFF